MHRIDSQYVEHQLRSGGIRYDAGEAAVFTRQLEYIATQTYDVKYPLPRSFDLIPVNNAIAPGAKYYTWRAFDSAGTAKRISDYADDAPNVALLGTENITPIADYANSYQYSIQDLRSSAMLSLPVDTRLALSARDKLQRKLDAVAAFGDSEVNISGFANNSNVPLVSPTTGTWSTATDVQILADMYKMEQSILNLTKGLEEPDTMIVPVSTMGIIATKPAGVNLDKTVLEIFLQRSRFIRNVESWYQLETANAAGNGPRVVAYKRDPANLQLIAPLLFEQQPPQARNFAFVVNCDARCGGVVFYYPKSAAYMDGV